jgi:hypothetical protein
MYFGNSDGTDPFIGGLIEGNQVVNTIGYNLQIKHQRQRPEIDGIPTGPRRTIIWRNRFVKARGGSEGPMARPNVLLGHLPVKGPGKDDEYVVYGNLFFQNPNEALFRTGRGFIKWKTLRSTRLLPTTKKPLPPLMEAVGAPLSAARSEPASSAGPDRGPQARPHNHEKPGSASSSSVGRAAHLITPISERSLAKSPRRGKEQVVGRISSCNMTCGQIKLIVTH